MNRFGNQNIAGSGDDRDTVELHFKCTNLDNEDGIFGESDAKAMVFWQKSTQESLFVGETEVKQDKKNPVFNTPVPIEYIFEIHQSLLVRVVDVDDNNETELIGEALFELAQVMASGSAGFNAPLLYKGRERGRVNIRGDNIGDERYEYLIDTSCTGVKDIEWFSKSDPFLRFYRPQDEFLEIYDPKGISEWSLVHQTEFKKDNLSPDFEPFKITSNRFCKNKERSLIKIEIVDHSKSGNHTLLSVGYFSISQLLEGNRSIQTFEGKNKSAVLHIQKFEKSRIYTLSDYLRGGVTLSLCVAYDFTASNGNPEDPESLHYIGDNQPNAYEKATAAVGSILEPYDADNWIPCYAFGFKAPEIGLHDVSFCYPISGNPSNPYYQGYRHIMAGYRQFAKVAIPMGPTNMAPIILEAINAAEANKNPKAYNILLILTDGVVSDRDATLAAIDKARNLPISILIVGIGNENMSDMKTLDDKVNSGARDIVQFVHFDKVASKSSELSEELLKEIPGQVTGYFKYKGFSS